MNISVGEKLLQAEVHTLVGRKTTLRELCAGRKTALYFMRDSACVLCQFELERLRSEYHRLQSAEGQAVVVVQSSVRCAKDILGEFPFAVVCDERGELYSLYGVKYAQDVETMGSPVVKARIDRAKSAGFVHGEDVGSTLILPALVIVDSGGRVCFALQSEYADEVQPLEEVALYLEQIK